MTPYMQGYPYQAPQYPAYQDRLAQLQNQYQQTIPQQQMQQVPQTNQGLLWVQGEAGAKSYLVAPNTTVLLMDSEGQRFYLKSTDGAGMPNLRTFEYTEIAANVPQPAQNVVENLDDKYVTREEYNNLQSRYMEIIDKLNSFPSTPVSAETSKRATRTRSKGGDSNEQSAV